MEIDFAGKAALVTGASRGIGREIAQQFSESAARVAINYRRNRRAAEQTVAELSGDGPAVVQSMTQTAIGEMSQIDVLVNNAGIYIDHPITDVGFDAWHAACRAPSPAVWWAPKRVSRTHESP